MESTSSAHKVYVNKLKKPNDAEGSVGIWGSRIWSGDVDYEN